MEEDKDQRYALHLTALVLAVALAISAAACGGGDGGSEEGTGTVTVLSLWGGSYGEAFQKVLTQFTKDTGIKTKYETARDLPAGHPLAPRGRELPDGRDHPAPGNRGFGDRSWP